MVYKVVDLFAGVGGLSYGFAHDSEFQIVAANELLEPMARAYSANHPKVKVYNKDIKEFSIDDLTRDLGLRTGDIDIVVGGPPCQAYSTVGKRLIDDPRGALFKEYFRMLKEIRPRLFVFENVKGLLSIQRGELIKQIRCLFESVGYRVDMKVVNSADYGAPQVRERVILIGSLDNRPFVYPKPTHYDPLSDVPHDGLKPYVTIGEALGDLPSIKSGESGEYYTCEPQNDYQRLMRENAPAELMDHNVSKNGEHLVKLMEALPDGGSPMDVAEELRPTSGFANCYCRLWWDKPSTTVARNLGCVSSSRCVHPKQPRPLSTREGARIQGFPDDFQFLYDMVDTGYKMIGNAVPVNLAYEIASAIREILERK